MRDIPFIYIPTTMKDFLGEENELFVDAGKAPGFEFASEEESKKILKDISRKVILQDSDFLLKFFLCSYGIFNWRSINDPKKELINHNERYILCSSSHNVNHNEEKIKFENSLIFPYGRENKSILGNIILGPKMPEIMKLGEGYGIKVLTGLEKEREIIRTINSNKLDPKIYGKYLDSIV